MKKILKGLVTAAITASLAVSAVSAYTNYYPASSKSEGIAAPTDGTIMIGTLIGAEGGWNDNPDVGRTAAFDGDVSTFYDPAAKANPEHYVGVKMPEAYVLTEIRICPRTNYSSRFKGAAIWGFNGDVFDPDKATLIWESDDPSDEVEFQVIKPAQFIDGTNKGFTSYAYYNEQEHGDVAEVELYGKPAAGAAATATETPAPAAVTKDDTPAPAPAAPAPAAPAPAQTSSTPAPRTGDMSIVITLAVLIATAFVTIKLTREKNRA